MTESQFREWQAYYSLEPWGLEALDWLFAGFKALIANINRKKSTRPMKPDRFLTFPVGPKMKEIDEWGRQRENWSSEHEYFDTYPLDNNQRNQPPGRS